jgi:hypothetical protein
MRPNAELSLLGDRHGVRFGVRRMMTTNQVNGHGLS